MPSPTEGDVHVDIPSTMFSVAYIQSQMDFVATRVAPVIPSPHRTGKYYVWPKDEWFRDEAQLRGDSEESAGSGMTLSTDDYRCDVWATHKDIGHLTGRNADAQVRLERAAAQIVARRCLLREEKQWVSTYFTTGVWGTDLTGVSSSPAANQFVYWSDHGVSNPERDVENARTASLRRTGFMPNTMVLGYEVFADLCTHPDFIERIKYTSDRVVTEDLIARLFRVDRLFVAKAVQNTADAGLTGTYSFTHGKSAWLGYVNPQPEMEAPSAMYTFMWDGVSQGLGETIGVSTIPIPLKKSTRYEAEIAFDFKVVGADLGTFFSGVVE